MLVSLTVSLLIALITGCASSTGHPPKLLSPERVTQGSVNGIECDKYVSTSGSDANDGSYAQPFATAEKLSDSLSPGQTGCFRAGVYLASNNTWYVTKGGTGEAERITFRSYPGETATFHGRLVTADHANYLTFWDMRFNSDNAPVTAPNSSSPGASLPSPTVNGDHNTFLNVDVTSNSNGVCFLLGAAGWGHAYYPEIRDSTIHDCGGHNAGHDHAIYAAQVTAARILNNLIVDAEARGVQLYPNSDGALVAGNVIDSNGTGVLFGGSSGQTSDNNEVSNNVISRAEDPSRGWLIEEFWTGPVGTGNTAHDNCLWSTHPNATYNQNDGVEPDAEGFSSYANVRADPMYADPVSGDYQIDARSGCSTVYPGP